MLNIILILLLSTMFNLCQFVHIHQHHYHEIVVPPHNYKQQTALCQSQFQNSAAFTKKKHASTHHSSKTHASVGSALRKQRKGIKVISRQAKKPNASLQHSLTPHNSCQQRYTKVARSLYQPSCSMPIPLLSRPPKLKDTRVSQSTKTPINCSLHIQKSVNPKQNMQMSSPVPQVKITLGNDLTYSSPHGLRPTQLLLSHMMNNSNSLGASTSKKLDCCSKMEHQLKKQRGLQRDELWKSQQYNLFKKQTITAKVNPDLELSNIRAQNRNYLPLRRSVKVASAEKQLFDAMSISSYESFNEDINIQESILVNRKIESFYNITPVRSMRDRQIRLAVEKHTNFIVCLKSFSDKHEKTCLQQSHLYQLTEKIQFNILALYQILLQEDQGYKKIIFVQQAFQVFLDDWVQRSRQICNQEQVKKILLSLQQTVQNVIVHFNELNYCLTEVFRLQDFVLVNQKVKLHLLSKFRHKSDCQDVKGVSILQCNQNLKHEFFQKLQGPSQ